MAIVVSPNWLVVQAVPQMRKNSKRTFSGVTRWDARVVGAGFKSACAGRSSAARRRHLFEFDHVAFRIADVNRESHAVRAVARPRFADHFHAALTQVTKHRVELFAFNSQSQMIHVEAPPR